jgi:hypothetical protein
MFWTNLRADRHQKISSAARVGFRPTRSMVRRLCGTSVAATREERRGGDVAGNGEVSGGKGAAVPGPNAQAFNETAAPNSLAQSPCGRACHARFNRGGGPLREQAGKQDAGLHLCASHRQRVFDRFEPASVDLEWRVASFARPDDGTHHGKRLDDPLHRPAREGLIAGNAALKRLCGEHSAQHAHGGAGVARVKRGSGFPQPVKALPMDHDRGAVPFHGDAERVNCSQCGLAIGPARVACDARWPFRQAAEDRSSVRDRLSPGRRTEPRNGPAR